MIAIVQNELEIDFTFDVSVDIPGCPPHVENEEPSAS